MFTLHRINMDEVLDVINLALELNIDAITIERITPMDKDIEKLYLSSEELKEIYNKIYRKKLK